MIHRFIQIGSLIREPENINKKSSFTSPSGLNTLTLTHLPVCFARNIFKCTQADELVKQHFDIQLYNVFGPPLTHGTISQNVGIINTATAT